MKAAALVLTAVFVAGAASPAQAQIGGALRKINKAIAAKEKFDALKITDAEEKQLGEQVSLKLRTRFGVAQSEPLTKYVSLVGGVLAQASTRPNLDWKFIVLDTDGVNAYAAPGGFIHVTRGLLGLMKTEAQLAGVLGHEIGHIVRRHHITVMQKSAALSAGARIAQRDNRSQLVNNLIGTGAEVMARGLDKGAEFEADQMGIILAARAGYSPYGLIEVLHKLSARAGDDASLALLFKTHPHPSERLSQLGEALSPRLPTLPSGKEPAIRQVGADVPAPAAANPVPAAGTRALQQDEPGVAPRPGGKSGIGIDPAGVLRGIFGR